VAARRDTMDQKQAIVLLSGGIDSAACTALARSEGFAVTALTFAYGQRHAVEVACARDVARAQGVVAHHIITMDLASVGGSVLTGPGKVPCDRDDPAAGPIPPTYVPARNTIFLAYAFAWAEARGASDIFIGVNHVDWSGYPDCRPEFIDAMQRVACVGTKAGVEGRAPVIRAPLLALCKAEIIRLASSLGVDLGSTVSCYDADAEGRACGRCDSCVLRKRGFTGARVADPTRYRE
jgi:7-cyano-7-deazaguanine synthase